jgi:tetratricopeptide (TPR) repeat protein
MGQPNCNVYKWQGDSACYEACLESTKAIAFAQGSKASQMHFDKAIALCPSFDYAFREKSVPYLKRGDFITWKRLMDEAMRLNPAAYLGVRGWCRYKFVADYGGAIQDIEMLDSLVNFDLGYTGDGDYHLQFIRALGYKGLGQKQKAIEIIEEHMGGEKYNALSYDYLHAGVLYLQTGDYKKAIAHLNQQKTINDHLAETYYYLALAYRKLHNKEAWEKNITKAREYYLKGRTRTDPYAAPMDKVYLVNIENESASGW